MKGFNKARKRLLLLYKGALSLPKIGFWRVEGRAEGEGEGRRRGEVISIFLFTILF